MSSKAPKVAILGFHLESNAFCPPSVEADFLAQCWEEGDAISELVGGREPALPGGGGVL
nr:hypothetical protein [Achromobacter denitrificans]